MDKKVYEFISAKTNDPIVERKTCKVNGQPFAIFQSDVDFYTKVSPVFSGKSYPLPLPEISPEERRRQRYLFKNDKILFKSVCAKSGKPIVTIYNPEIHKNVYSVKERRSDSRDPMSYGQEIDFQEDFWTQYRKLYDAVPKIAMVNDNGNGSENCEYSENVVYSKDCYLTAVSRKLRNCHYDYNMATGEDLLDCFFSMDSRVGYECVNCYNIFQGFFLSNSNDCTDCRRGYDLAGCQDCIGCVGQRNKQYMLRNVQVTKEEFEHAKQELMTAMQQDITAIHDKFIAFTQTFPKKAMNIVNGENAFGHNLVNAQHAIACYNIKNLKSCHYCTFGDTLEDAHDLTTGGELQLCYQGIVPDHSYHTCFSIFCWSCSDVRYSEMCHHCKDCRGCVGLRNKQYCIFNKQYSRETYEILVPQLIKKMEADGIWGLWFPQSMSPFAYNESLALFFDPLTEEEARAQGYTRRPRTVELNIPPGVEILQDFSQYDEKYLSDKAIRCTVSGRPFKLIPNEIAFYRLHKLPLPRKHPDVRFQERVENISIKDLYLIHCKKCNDECLTPYKDNGNVYCEACYNKEIYG